MPELHFALLFRFFIVFSAMCAAVALSWWIYRITIPAVSRSMHIVLVTLRSIGIFLIFILIGEPILTLITHPTELPSTCIVIDNSRSMAITDKQGKREEIVQSLLRSPLWNDISSRSSQKFIAFQTQAKTISKSAIDSLRFDGDATDIANALQYVKQTTAGANLQAIVLITDGNSTSGESPLYSADELAVPIFTIGVGDTSAQKDILIRRAITNEITYVGNRVPVNITLHSSGFNGERVEILLKDDVGVIDRKMVSLLPGDRDYSLSLSFIPQKEGMQKYSVEVSSLPGELTTHNNRMTLFTKVLKTKLHVVVIAGAPNPDIAFFRRALEQDKNMEVSDFIERVDGKFINAHLTEQALGNADCSVLIGYPSSQSPSMIIQTVQNVVLNTGKPLFVLLGRTMDYERLRMLDQLLPFTTAPVAANEFQVFASVQESERNNPILKLQDVYQINALWDKLPPIFRLQTDFHAKPGTEILASIRLASTTLNEPLIVSRNVGGRKSIAVLGYGIWRWKMLSDASDVTSQIYDHFVLNSVRWLTTREDERRVRVQPMKQIFTSQDEIGFTGQVYSETYQALDDAQVSVTVTRGHESYECVLSSLGSGQYQGALDRLPAGDYRYNADVSINGTKLGSDSGIFSVGGLNEEYLDTRMNYQLLQQIAGRTGGKFYQPIYVESIAKDIASLPSFKPRELTRASGFEMWNSYWTLSAIILIFSIEWFLRKRNGML